jgi:two-component system, chemotaxis family, chemotaxis protein CheY
MMVDPAKAQVLVVDDDQSVRLMMTTVLDYAGYSVLEAQDGIEALAILRTSAYPLVVLLDWMMPQMSGEEVLQAVKDGTGALRRHAFVLVTANTPTRSPHLLELLRELCVPVMPKPFRLQHLLNTVAEHDRRINTMEPVS